MNGCFARFIHNFEQLFFFLWASVNPFNCFDSILAIWTSRLFILSQFFLLVASFLGFIGLNGKHSIWNYRTGTEVGHISSTRLKMNTPSNDINSSNQKRQKIENEYSKLGKLLLSPDIALLTTSIGFSFTCCSAFF